MRLKGLIYFILILKCALSYGSIQMKESSSFRFHINNEPSTFDPHQSPQAWNSFVHYNLYRSFYILDKNSQLKNELIKSCRWIHSLRLECELKKNRYYSNGEIIPPEDYARPFQRVFLNLSQPQILADLIHLKNAQKIIEKKLPVNTLGVKIIKQKIVFTFDQQDRDFLLRLSNPYFSPRPDDSKFKTDEDLAKNYATGPYRLMTYIKQKKIKMTPHPFYDRDHTLRPPIEILIVSEDATALRLYQKNQLQFHRRVPQEQFIALSKDKTWSSHLHTVSLARMDYIGMAGSLKSNIFLREALISSLNYEELFKILPAKSRPGCISLSADYYSGEPLCYFFDLDKAKKKLKDSQFKTNEKLELLISLQSGDDVKKTAEWLQNQWKKHLGLRIEIQNLDFKLMTQRLSSEAPDLFRKGVPLMVPSCSNALSFLEKNAIDNFLKVNDSTLTRLLTQMKQTSNSEAKNKSLCRQALQRVLDLKVLIPMGEMNYHLLAHPQFKGWSINSLNQLNLSNLRIASKF